MIRIMAWVVAVLVVVGYEGQAPTGSTTRLGDEWYFLASPLVGLVS